MDKIWIVIQEVKITCDNEPDSFETDFLSGWTTFDLAQKEVNRLRLAGYRRIHFYGVTIKG